HRAHGCIAIGEKNARFLQDDFTDVPTRWNLAAPLVDFALRFRGYCLVRRHRIDGKKSIGMTREPVESDQAYPVIDEVARAGVAALAQIFSKRYDFPQRLPVIKDEQIFGKLFGVGEIDLRQALFD